MPATMPSLFESLSQRLAAEWKQRKTEKKLSQTYRCRCGAPIFFLNTQCLTCKSALGYLPHTASLVACDAGPVAESRKKQEAAQYKKAEAERQAKREVYLRTLAADFDRCWQAADERAERGIASAYDGVQHALVDLADAYTLCASRADFDLKLAGFMARHGKRGALARRLSDARLWKKS